MTLSTGQLRMTPGAPVPHTVRSTRRHWANLLGVGKPADDLPVLLSRIYNLCGYAHELCAQAAVEAARGGTFRAETAQRRQLQLGTVREHVRCMWLDWPRQLAGLAGHHHGVLQAEAAVMACPGWAFHPGDSLAANPANTANPANEMQDWLRQHALGEDLAPWLAAWEADPAHTLQRWSQQAQTPLASLMRVLMDLDAPDLLPDQDLSVDVDVQELKAWAADLRANSQLCLAPLWHGQCARTGAWSRRRDPQRQAMTSTALRMGARLAELVRLCLPDQAERCGAQWLDAGSLCVAPGEGLAWLEMARGLLIHHVQLTPDGVAVQSCQVIAPTEWNFHPQGAFARTLAAMPDRSDEQAWAAESGRFAALVASFDPCVPFVLEREVAYA